MTLSIHQPNFLPWLGLIDKIKNSDIFLIMDNVQFEEKQFQNRTKIKTSQGDKWLTVPIHYQRPQKINEVLLCDYQKAREKILKTIKVNYSKAPYFDKYYKNLRAVLEQDYKDLLRLNVGIIVWLKEEFHIKTEIKLASSINDTDGEKKEQWIIDTCKKLGADTYLSGTGGCMTFIRPEHFQENGIKFKWQTFNHPKYEQPWGEFVPNLSAIDYLFNKGDII